MKYWSRRKIVGGSAPKPITRIGLELVDAIELQGREWPKLLRIGRHDNDEDVHRFEVDVELAPGLILPMEHGLTETTDEEWDGSENDEVSVFDWTMEGVNACLSNIEDLSQRVHDARLKVRSIVAGWREKGLPARVVDVHLAPYDHWRGDSIPQLRVLLETLDDRLEVVVCKLDEFPTGNLEATLVDAYNDLADRSPRRDTFMRQGATGQINQVALNAIALFGDVAQTLRRFATEGRFWLPDGTCILMRDGMVDAGNYRDATNILWRANGISVSTAVELRRDVATCVGRPVTELIEHPLLSPDMSVLKATWDVDHQGDRWLDIDLAMPWRFFCSRSGRVWDVSEESGGAEPLRDSGNVVPFGRRRA